MSIIMAASTSAGPIGQIIYGVLLDKFKSNVYITILIASVLIAVMAYLTKITLTDKNAPSENR